MSVNTAYEGASTGFKLGRKGLNSGSPDLIASRELEFLWKRSHNLCRNNPMAVTAKNRLVSHWVGTGITVHWGTKRMQRAWDEFVQNCAADGYGNLYNIQNLWGHGLFETGDIFTRMLIERGKKDSTIPLKLQVIAAEQLDPKYFNAGKNIKNGIEFNSMGLKPEQYHFWEHHPSMGFSTGVNKKIIIPKDKILHLFDRNIPGQWRGIPKATPAMLLMYEMDELTDATLVRQKAAQAVGWIIKKKDSGALPPLGGVGEAISEFDVNDPSLANQKIQKIVSGGVHYLRDDEDFEFAAIDDIGNNFVSLLEYNTRMIGSCLDVTYEQLTGDLSSVNFSSLRGGLIEFKKRVSLMQQLVLVNLGLIPLTEYFKDLASIYISRSAAKVTCEFAFPKQEWVDALKDTQADVLEIQAGLATLRGKLAERGVKDIEAHISQVLQEQNYEPILTTNPKHKLNDQKSTKPKKTEVLE